MKSKINILAIFSAAIFVIFSAGCSGSANDADTFLQMSAKAAQNGKNSDALMLAKDACMVSPDNVEALLMRSLMAERCGDNALALDSALQAAKLAPNNAGALYTVGRLYSNSNDTAAEAMSYLEKALSFNPNDVNTLILLSNLAVVLKSEKALDYLRKLESLDSEIVNSFEGKTLFGHAHAIRGNSREATLAFGVADRKEKSILSNYNYAVALDCIYTKKPSLAIARYKTFLKQSGSDKEWASLRKDVERRLKKLTRRR